MLHPNRLSLTARLVATRSAALVLILLLLLACTPTAEAQTPTPSRSGLYLNIGKSYQKAAQPDKATEFYLKALEADPTNLAALVALRSVLQPPQMDDPRLTIADEYLEAGKHDKAIELYLEILADRPGLLDAQARGRMLLNSRMI